jgi:hypothetical protein
MVIAQFIKTRVSPQTKRCVQTAAQQQLITESIWLRRLVDAALRSTPVSDVSLVRRSPTRSHATRLCVRLRADDQRLLKERAAARSMAPATYVSVLVRAHLHDLAPLPKEELLALKRSVAELGAIGRNLNQIARATNAGGRVAPGRDDLRAMLKVCEGLRDHVKGLIKANVSSWETGDAKAGN